MGYFVHDPGAVLDYGVDWSDWRSSTAETVSSSTWRSSSTSLVVLTTGAHAMSTTGWPTNTVWVSGGTPGELVTVTNRITSNQNRTDERWVTLRVEDR